MFLDIFIMILMLSSVMLFFFCLLTCCPIKSRIHHWRPCHQVFSIYVRGSIGGIEGRASFVCYPLSSAKCVCVTYLWLLVFWWHLMFLPLRLRLCEYEYEYGHVNCKWYSIRRDHFNKTPYMLWLS